ncbi:MULTISPECIES: hypothetical protein [Paraburkholderia]|uniref:hypothetical protein n=1 Tax=Paraburkholderia TaxID=1822464 RepID=UPI001FD0ABC2|nr:hypothetical protein [Paraburkholderia terricola]
MPGLVEISGRNKPMALWWVAALACMMEASAAGLAAFAALSPLHCAAKTAVRLDARAAADFRLERQPRLARRRHFPQP